jgi:hypothetical protein
VPDSVWDQTDLETLLLANNDLSAISEQIGRLKHLRMLDLGHNALTSVPESLADLDSLSDLLYLHDKEGRQGGRKHKIFKISLAWKMGSPFRLQRRSWSKV